MTVTAEKMNSDFAPSASHSEIGNTLRDGTQEKRIHAQSFMITEQHSMGLAPEI